MELVSTFAERLSSILKQKNISITEFAQNIGLSKQAVSSYCTGTRSPKRPTIDSIARELNLNPMWLIGYDVSIYPIPPKAETGDKRLDGIIATYHELNEEGKDDLAKHAEHLTYIPEYKKCDTLSEESQKTG